MTKINDFTNGPVWDERLQRHVCDLRLPDGTRVRKRFRRRRQAENWWKAITRRIDDGTWGVDPGPTSLGDAFDQYRRAIRLTHNAFASYDSILKFWERVLGRNVPLATVSTFAIEEALASRIKDVAPSTANGSIVVLRRVFSWLESRYKHVHNPTTDLKVFKVNNERVVYLEADQFERLVRSCMKSKWWFLAAVVVVAAGTGLRKSNVMNLKWSEVDRKSGTIRVTKTKSGRTVEVPMGALVCDVLGRIYETRRSSEYVFPRGGDGLDSDLPVHYIYREFNRAVADSGIAEEFERSGRPPLRFHDLRHTFASVLALEGVSLDVIAILLGHGDTRTVRRYAHLSPEYMKKEIARIDAMFTKTFPKAATICGT